MTTRCVMKDYANKTADLFVCMHSMYNLKKLNFLKSPSTAACVFLLPYSRCSRTKSKIQYTVFRQQPNQERRSLMTAFHLIRKNFFY